MTEPKRKRTYEGEQLERRRAYQRQYNQQQRDEAKAAKHRPLRPIEIAQQRQPSQKSGEKAEMAQFARKWAAQELCMEAWQAEIEADYQRYSHDWHDESREFFERLRERAG